MVLSYMILGVKASIFFLRPEKPARVPRSRRNAEDSPASLVDTAKKYW